MIVEKAIAYILNNTTSITALVGNRIYNTFAPQGTALPYVTFTIAPGGVQPYDTKSTTQGGADLDRVTFEIHSYAADSKSAAQIDETIRSVLDRHPAGAVNGVNLDGVRYVYTTKYPEPGESTDGGAVVMHYVSEYVVRVKY
ncbi:MAG: DUF3168 domain-containing protein [Chloroflexi bacterium]|nr:MAG: DUF3168 domain-containing protein [Chloroflexota bacterium]